MFIFDLWIVLVMFCWYWFVFSYKWNVFLFFLNLGFGLGFVRNSLVFIWYKNYVIMVFEVYLVDLKNKNFLLISDYELLVYVLSKFIILL